MHTRIDKVYDEEKSKLLAELRDFETVALTTDTWTSNSVGPHALYTSVEKHLLIRVTGYSIGRSTD